MGARIDEVIGGAMFLLAFGIFLLGVTWWAVQFVIGLFEMIF